MSPLFVAFGAVLGTIVSLVAFVTVWVNVGIYKGATDNRIKVLEDKNTALECRVNEMGKEKNAFEKEVSGFITEIRTKLDFIFQGINELKKKQENDDATQK